MAAPSAWLPNRIPMAVPPWLDGVEFEQPRLQHGAYGEQKEAEEGDEDHEQAGPAGERHAEQHHHGHRHAADDDTLAPHPIGEMSGNRRHREARGLKREHADADPFRRIAHLPRQVERQKRQQRALRHGAECRAERNHHQRLVFQKLAQIAQAFAQGCAGLLVRMVAADAQPADQHQNDASHQDAGHDVDDHNVAPTRDGQKPSRGQRRQRIANIAAHAVNRNDEALALWKRAREQRDRGRMPEIVADADKAGAGEQRPVGMREAHQQIRCADPAQRQRHEQALARHRVRDHSARNVGQRAADELTGQDRTDLLVAEVQLVADQRQQQIERRRIPVGERVAERDEPDVGERPGGARGRGYCKCRHPGRAAFCWAFRLNFLCGTEYLAPILLSSHFVAGGLTTCNFRGRQSRARISAHDARCATTNDT